MNIGKLRERGFILRLGGERDLRWQPERLVWMEVTQTGRRNLFSQFGAGKSGAEVLLRAGDLRMDDAILWRGQHFFISEIQETGRCPRYLKVSCARVTPEIAEVSRITAAMGAGGRAVNTRESRGSCPVCLTEKYLGDKAEDSHMERRERLIAVAPKALVCEPGDILRVLEEDWRVMICHTLERHKNEYEIERVADD